MNVCYKILNFEEIYTFAGKCKTTSRYDIKVEVQPFVKVVSTSVKLDINCIHHLSVHRIKNLVKELIIKIELTFAKL